MSSNNDDLSDFLTPGEARDALGCVNFRFVSSPLKAVATLQAQAKNSGATQLSADSSLSKKLRNAIADLETRAKDHDVAADLARDAARQLRQLMSVGRTNDTPSKPVTTKPATKAKPAKLPRTVKAKTAAPKKVSPVKKAVATSTPVPTAKAKSPAKARVRSKGAPTLADAIHHVLKSRQDQNAGGAKAKQLHAEVLQAGYRFGGNNVENQMNYLHKTLRQHAARFKRGADGIIALA